MKIEFLVATINRTNIDFINNIFQNISLDECFVLVINQCINIPTPHEEIISSYKNVRVISVKDKGTSNSRNLALSNMIGDIGVFVDDDVIYEPNVVLMIKEAYILNPNYDIITFKSKYQSGKPFKKYKEKNFIHNFFSLRSIGDNDISFKADSVRNIKFNLKFGLGSLYPQGEYNIFLRDCIRQKLKLFFIPKFILTHVDGDHSGTTYKRNIEEGRGAMYAELYGYSFFVFALYFAVKKYRIYSKKGVSFFEEIKNLLRGGINYIKSKNE